MADVRKAVRLGRKARGDLAAKAVARDVLRDHFANEVTVRAGTVESAGGLDTVRRANSGRSDGNFSKYIHLRRAQCATWFGTVWSAG